MSQRQPQQQQQQQQPEATCHHKSKFASVTAAATEPEAVVDAALQDCYQQLGEAIPLPPLIKYPRTTHLFNTGGTATTSDDLILNDLVSALPVFCNGRTRVIVEEKVDGPILEFRRAP